jgi:hypothetical protein
VSCNNRGNGILLAYVSIQGDKNMANIIPAERLEKCILLIRGQKVMLSTELAGLYGVEPKVLVQAVKRNTERFPDDFMFQLTHDEAKLLRSQIVTLKTDEDGRGKHMKYLPYAFTEQGVAMLSSVLRSKQAVQVNIEIMRSFVRLRQILFTHEKLAKKLLELEKKYDMQFKAVFEAIWKLMEVESKPKRRIGFVVGDKE